MRGRASLKGKNASRRLTRFYGMPSKRTDGGGHRTFIHNRRERLHAPLRSGAHVHSDDRIFDRTVRIRALSTTSRLNSHDPNVTCRTVPVPRMRGVTEMRRGTTSIESLTGSRRAQLYGTGEEVSQPPPRSWYALKSMPCDVL